MAAPFATRNPTRQAVPAWSTFFRFLPSRPRRSRRGRRKISKNPAADSGTEQPTDQRPAPVQQNVDAPQTAKNFKLQRRHESVETRVIHELHRHGIYW
jgi:hypothetical protein